jgi:hypothetical protein
VAPVPIPFLAGKRPRVVRGRHQRRTNARAARVGILTDPGHATWLLTEPRRAAREHALVVCGVGSPGQAHTPSQVWRILRIGAHRPLEVGQGPGR